MILSLGSGIEVKGNVQLVEIADPPEEVVVQADWDGRGWFGLADVSPGYTAMRYIVTVESSAPEAEIMAMLDELDRNGHLLSVARDAVPVTREVRLTAPVEA